METAKQIDTNIKNQKGLSTSFIKTIALICMFIDHFAASVVFCLMSDMSHPFMVKVGEWLGTSDAFGTYQVLLPIYSCMRNIGRVSFPIYCFFIVEGFLRTRSRKKYARRLAVCALLSEIPFDLALFGKVFYFGHQNVFFTLLFGMLAIWVIDTFMNKEGWGKGKKIFLSTLCGFGFYFAAELMFTDYSSFGVTAIVLMYLVRKIAEQKIKIWAPIVFAVGTAVLCLLSLGEAWAFMALPLFFFYHGKKGWNAKWFFYLFYPVHLLLLGIARVCLTLQGIMFF